MKHEDGGPAFPTRHKDPDQWDGMTLRDAFALAAVREASLPADSLKEILAMRDPAETIKRYQAGVNNIAKWAYIMADAMLKAREE